SLQAGRFGAIAGGAAGVALSLAGPKKVSGTLQSQEMLGFEHLKVPDTFFGLPDFEPSVLSQVRKVPGKEPAAAWAGEGPELDQPRATMVEDKANILVVDDLPEKLLAMEVMLEELGQNVVSAQSGREALRRLLDQDFAVILLDVNMPDMDGFETAALIRQRRRSAH